MTLPHTFYMSKKFFMKTLATTVFLMVLSVVVFWFGSGKLFTEDYYPAAVLACPLLFIISVAWLIIDAREYLGEKPYAEISAAGIQLFNGVYKEIGIVPWREITGYREMAAANSQRGRRLYFYARYPEHFTDKISSEKKRNLFKKTMSGNGEAVLMIETSRLDCDITGLKKTIDGLINQIQ